MQALRLQTCAAVVLLLFASITSARIERDHKSIADFKQQNPCPSTGKGKGACPGWEIDHKTPLKCGGADRPDNMQWLTKPDHKAKTRREIKACTWIYTP